MMQQVITKEIIDDCYGIICGNSKWNLYLSIDEQRNFLLKMIDFYMESEQYENIDKLNKILASLK